MITVIFFENYQGFAKDKDWAFSTTFAQSLISLGVAYDKANPPKTDIVEKPKKSKKDAEPEN